MLNCIWYLLTRYLFINIYINIFSFIFQILFKNMYLSIYTFIFLNIRDVTRDAPLAIFLADSDIPFFLEVCPADTDFYRFRFYF